MSYTPTYTKPYTNGWKNLPEETTPITAEALNAIDNTLETVEEQLASTTAIFDEEKNGVYVGNKDSSVKPSNAGIFGGYNDVSISAVRSLTSGYNNKVNAEDCTVSGTGNTVESGAVYNNVSGQKNIVTSSSIGNAVSGFNNTVDGNYNSVAGQQNEVTANGAIVAGTGLKTFGVLNSPQGVVGTYNDSDEQIDSGKQVLFAVGNGKSDSARSNAFLVDEDGNVSAKGKIYQSNGEEIKSGAKQSAVYDSYGLAVSALNSASSTDFEKGQPIRIMAQGVPDLYIASVESTSTEYTYADTLIADIKKTGKQKIGYFNVSLVEADGYAPASIMFQSHYLFQNALLNAGDSYFESLKMKVGQNVHIKQSGQSDLYIYSKETSSASYTYKGDLEGDIVSAGGLLQIGYYKVGLLQAYVAVPTYEETLEILNSEE